MSSTRADELGRALDEFLRQSPDLEAPALLSPAVVSLDRLPI